MACAELRDELNCSICLNLYSNPVTLPCDHVFCQGCIGDVLDTQKESGLYSCPECRAQYKGRPGLRRNRKLGNIVEQFHITEPEETRILCTYCLHSAVPATKTCLLCEASLCDTHIKVHSKAAEHVLTEPTPSPGNRKCLTHHKILEYYCCVDGTCVCVSCCLAGDHRGHKVELLNEAAEMMKGKQRKVLEKLITNREEVEKMVENLQNRRRKIKGNSASVRERISTWFINIKKQLEVLEKQILSEISGQEEKGLLQIADVIQQVEIEKDEVNQKIHHIEELCSMADPLTILQGRKLGWDVFCDDEEEGYDGRKEDDKHFSAWGDQDWNKTLLSGLGDIVSSIETEIYGQKSTATNSTSNRPTIGAARVMSPDELPDTDRQGSKDLNEAPSSLAPHTVTDPLYGQQVTEMVFDINTANSNLSVSQEVYYSTGNTYFRTPERFQDYPQVLSIRSFASGHYYWDIQCQSASFIAGVAYRSIDRYNHSSYIGNNNKSVGLHKWNNNYSVLHDSQRKDLCHRPTCNRIRISLDYDGGRLSFYELSDPIKHLHTVTAKFTEPLHAAFLVRGEYYSPLTIIT
ncbi:hypothetical protein GDO86_000030 [Hymenochirus boettgeri]|uniref:Uncharacterized protein n=1 Tax=Hymenochirus boettgeri TaxID=247094 RepID=A0A8T2KA20_9PIPI|nr:hypothetical protein GDO86_000030 [Hymenochirus boettgeri]